MSSGSRQWLGRGSVRITVVFGLLFVLAFPILRPLILADGEETIVFVRGDVDGNGRVEAQDVRLALFWLVGEEPVATLEALDVVDDGRVTIDDVYRIYGFIESSPAPERMHFSRGDLDDDGTLTQNDVQMLRMYLHGTQHVVGAIDAVDFNADGWINDADYVALNNHVEDEAIEDALAARAPESVVIQGTEYILQTGPVERTPRSPDAWPTVIDIEGGLYARLDPKEWLTAPWGTCPTEPESNAGRYLGSHPDAPVPGPWGPTDIIPRPDRPVSLPESPTTGPWGDCPTEPGREAATGVLTANPVDGRGRSVAQAGAGRNMGSHPDAPVPGPWGETDVIPRPDRPVSLPESPTTGPWGDCPTEPGREAATGALTANPVNGGVASEAGRDLGSHPDAPVPGPWGTCPTGERVFRPDLLWVDGVPYVRVRPPSRDDAPRIPRGDEGPKHGPLAGSLPPQVDLDGLLYARVTDPR